MSAYGVYRPTGPMPDAATVHGFVHEGKSTLQRTAVVPSQTQQFSGSRLGHDFSRVRVHTGAPDGSVLFRQGPAKRPTKPAPERVVPCTEEQNALIRQGLTEGATLADEAATVLGRITYPGRGEAIRKHFGAVKDGEIDSIKARFERIRDALPAKKVVCLDHCIPTARHKIECARGQVGGNLIQVCPAYGGASGVCAVGVTMLHEAAHNDGATGDVDTDGDYPPKNAGNNTYSYENFAAVATKGVPEPQLRPHAPVEIQVPE
jgi:hypothetical protein